MKGSEGKAQRVERALERAKAREEMTDEQREQKDQETLRKHGSAKAKRDLR